MFVQPLVILVDDGHALNEGRQVKLPPPLHLDTRGLSFFTEGKANIKPIRRSVGFPPPPPPLIPRFTKPLRHTEGGWGIRLHCQYGRSSQPAACTLLSELRQGKSAGWTPEQGREPSSGRVGRFEVDRKKRGSASATRVASLIRGVGFGSKGGQDFTTSNPPCADLEETETDTPTPPSSCLSAALENPLLPPSQTPYLKNCRRRWGCTPWGSRWWCNSPPSWSCPPRRLPRAHT